MTSTVSTMVSIIIVNWNTGERLAACLRSLTVLPEKRLIKKLYVVDNASKDQSLEHARAVGVDIPVDIIRLKRNSGFAAANNIALERIYETGVTHVLLLNPDTEVKAGALTALISQLAKDSNIGIVGPRLRNPDGSIQPSVRSFPTVLVFIWLFLKLSRVFPKVGFWQRYLKTDFDYTKAQAVDQVMGAAFLIRDHLLNNIGFLDDRFWIWFEEVDFCKRASYKGWSIWYTPEAEVTHYGAISFNQKVGLQRTLPFLHSSLTYAHKHLSKLSLLVLCLLYPVAVALSLPATAYHMLTRQTNRARLHA